MDTGDVILKSIPSIRVAELSAPAASYEGTDITEALSPLYPQLMERMQAAGMTFAGSPMAYYLPAPTGPGDESITVHAAFPVTGDPAGDLGFDIVDLPAVRHAATLLHHGPMQDAGRTVQVLARWIDDNGYRAVDHGYAREVYLECPMDDLSKWVTELQVAVTPSER